MSNNVLSIFAAEPETSQPDHIAQRLWKRVADAADGISMMVENICGVTVRGSESRAELVQVDAMLNQVLAILVCTCAREAPRYEQLAHDLGIN